MKKYKPTKEIFRVCKDCRYRGAIKKTKTGLIKKGSGKCPKCGGSRFIAYRVGG